MRKFNRKKDQIRDISIEPNVNMNSDGSCIIRLGNTHVLCTASFENDTPQWLKNKDSGWITAEYGMLPGSTSTRNKREATKGKQTGRTIEIQRLIGRSLRTVVDLKKIKGCQLILDCDVIQADGGTRTASITGGCVALFLAIKNHHDDQRAIKSFVAAVSMGIKENQVLLDLDYDEDSTADTDLNIVMNDKDELIEIQGTAEDAPFSKKELDDMLYMGSEAVADIIKKQKACIE